MNFPEMTETARELLRASTTQDLHPDLAAELMAVDALVPDGNQTLRSPVYVLAVLEMWLNLNRGVDPLVTSSGLTLPPSAPPSPLSSESIEEWSPA